MQTINVLIVEDISDVRKLIKVVLEDFNSNSMEVKIKVVGEAWSYATAEGLIQSSSNTTSSVQLVLLDHHLIGRKRGLELRMAFPNLAYIVISDDEQILNQVDSIADGSTYIKSFRKNKTGTWRDIYAYIKNYIDHLNKKG